VVNLVTTPKSERVFDQDYLVIIKYSDSGFYIDCRNDSIFNEYKRWTIHHNSNNRIVFYVDNMSRELDISEFFEFVAVKTPEYADALLFMLPDPKSYFDGIDK